LIRRPINRLHDAAHDPSAEPFGPSELAANRAPD
jgi:hypothetical protein